MMSTRSLELRHYVRNPRHQGVCKLEHPRHHSLGFCTTVTRTEDVYSVRSNTALQSRVRSGKQRLHLSDLADEAIGQVLQA